jgi:subtilisin family serine protease
VAKSILGAVLLLLCVGVPGVLASPAVGESPTRWIVQTHDGTGSRDIAAQARTRWGVPVGARFNTVFAGFSAQLTVSQRAALEADPRVTAIVPDRPIHAAGDPYPTTDLEIQPGVRRVRATDNADRSDPHLDVDIAILDTGLQPDNAELNIAAGYNCTDPGKPDSWADSASFGHGTHVAGIAAAIENGRGVAGVAQGARLWPIKVLDGSGNGYWSWVICGLDRVAQMRDPNNSSVPRIEVVNMSLAAPGWDDGDCGQSNNDLLHQAVCRVEQQGITMVAAAGNTHEDAADIIPASYDEVITVSAMADWNGQAAGAGSPPEECPHTEADDSFAKFSDFGADVDLIAPGVCVVSLLPNDRLGSMSGTSMATPHVTGGAALYFLEEARKGRPRPTPHEVRAALVAAGNTDWQTSTDPDRGKANGVREPALDVADLSLPASFTIGTDRQVIRAAAGAHVENGLWIARLGGFEASVTWHVDASSLPAGSQTSIVAGRRLTIDVPANASPGSYHVALTATSGDHTEHATFELIIPTQTSDSGGPVIGLATGGHATNVQLPVSVKWPAVARATKYRVAVRVDEGAWGAPVKTAKTKTAFQAWPGRRYQVRVQAKVGGIWGPWKVGPSSVVNAVEPSSDLSFTGNWAMAPIKKSYSELPVMATANGASATYSFTGRSVAWLAVKAADRGKASVAVDGVTVGTVDLRASTKTTRVTVFSRSWASAGAHTIKITVLGAPAAHPRVDDDALIVVSD